MAAAARISFVETDETDVGVGEGSTVETGETEVGVGEGSGSGCAPPAVIHASDTAPITTKAIASVRNPRDSLNSSARTELDLPVVA